MSCIGLLSKLPQRCRFATVLRFALNSLYSVVLVSCFGGVSQAAGPLNVHSNNPRFFMDANGRSIYLTGVHLNNSLVDRSDKSAFNFTNYLNFLQQHEHNFVRLWTWEQTGWDDENDTKISFAPLPYLRSGPGIARDKGPKFDLTRFNQDYFDRLRSRVVEAGERGIYVSVMLFQGFSSQRKALGSANPWTSHPFNRNNNVNGVDGDPSRNGEGEEVYTLIIPTITMLQEAYVRKIVDTLNDLDNVLYEISGEGPLSSREWQYYIINYLKSYQATKPKQHPVGMSSLYLGEANDLLASPADWILLPGTDRNPPMAAGNKVILSDMDPALLGDRMSYSMTWKLFMRGFNPLYLESDLFHPRVHEAVRDSMGYTLKYSQLVDLSSMSPSSELCSTGYCLINPGSEYLVYLPTGGTVRVDLSDASGSFVASWFSPVTGQTAPGGTVSGGQPVVLTAPINGDTVLYLQIVSEPSAQGSLSAAGLSIDPLAVSSNAAADSTIAVAAPTISPNGGSFTNPATVTLLTSTSEASIFYTTDGTDPTPSSTEYSAPFTLATTSLLKAKAFKAGMSPSVTVSAWFTVDASGMTKLAAVSADETSSNAITLTWADNSNNESGFRIQRKTGSNGTFAQIAAVAANINSYTDVGLINGNTYCYRVNAYNSVGASGYTNEACKTIAAPTTFNFSLSTGGNKSVTQGQSVTNSVTATLTSGTSQSVSFSTSGVPTGATASYGSSNSCSPTCSRTLTIATSSSTPTATYPITVTVTGGGVLKTVSFNLTVTSGSSGGTGNTITVEAEAGNLTAPMVARSNSQASGGQFVEVPNGAGNNQNDATNGGPGQVSFSIYISSAGTYALWARTIAPGGGSDSFYVTWNNNTILIREWSVPQSTTWQWNKVKEISLPAGNFNFEFRQREDGTQLDKILLSSVPNFNPN